MGLHRLDSSSKEEKGAQEIEEIFFSRNVSGWILAICRQIFFHLMEDNKKKKQTSHETIVQVGFFFTTTKRNSLISSEIPMLPW